MRQNDQTQTGLSAEIPSGMGTCDYCKRYTPFTAAIQAGKPLNVVCTCAIEQRTIERFVRVLARVFTRVEGH